MALAKRFGVDGRARGSVFGTLPEAHGCHGIAKAEGCSFLTTIAYEKILDQDSPEDVA
jgi:hypothetical protein